MQKPQGPTVCVIQDDYLVCYADVSMIYQMGDQPYTGWPAPKRDASFKIPLDQLTLIRFEKGSWPAKYQKHNLYRLFFIEKPLDVCTMSVHGVSADSMMEIDRFCKEHGIKFVDIDNEPFLVPYDGYVAERGTF